MSVKNQLTTSDFLEFSEYERLLQCLHRDGKYIWEAFACISFCTALRVSDVLSLKWKDILNKSKIQVIEKKTKKTREIPMNKSVQDKIASLYKDLGKPEIDSDIFISRKDGSVFTRQHINKKLKMFKAQYKLKIGNFSTHTFRKTFGRYVYEKKGRSAEALVLLNKIFNHTSIQITKTYIGITQQEINKLYDEIKL